MFVVYKRDYDESKQIGFVETEEEAIDYCQVHNEVGMLDEWSKFYYLKPNKIQWNRSNVKVRNRYRVFLHCYSVKSVDRDIELTMVCDRDVVITDWLDGGDGIVIIYAETEEDVWRIVKDEIQ